MNNLTPLKPTDFIGKTRAIAQVLFTKADRIRQDPKLPALHRRWLFLGPPGVAKSTLALLLARTLTQGSGDWRIEHLVGSSLGIDIVRHWREDGRYIHTGISVKLVDEIDATPGAALNDLRLYLDQLPSSTVFIATTNKELKELQPQLQGRFQQWPFAPVPTDEIAAYIMANLHLDPANARRIAAGANGDVRSALEDAISHLDVQALAAAA